MKRSKENGKRKKMTVNYDDRREEYGSEYGRKKKDKNKKDKNKKEQPEGIQAEGTFIGHPKGFGFVEIEGRMRISLFLKVIQEQLCIRIK